MYKTVLEKPKKTDPEYLEHLLDILSSRFTLTAHFLAGIYIPYKVFKDFGFINAYLGDKVFEEQHGYSNDDKIHIVLDLKKCTVYPHKIHQYMLHLSDYVTNYMINDKIIVYVFDIPKDVLELFKDGKYSKFPSYAKKATHIMSDARAIQQKVDSFLEKMIEREYFDEGLVELIYRNDAEFWSKPDIEKEILTTYDIFRV